MRPSARKREYTSACSKPGVLKPGVLKHRVHKLSAMNSLTPALRTNGPGRGGFLAPAALIALVVVLGAAGLVIDRLWLDNAQVELTNAAEAAALAGARSLATDALLLETVDEDGLVNDARSAALRIARENRIAGEAVMLDPADDGDVRIGCLVQNDAGHTVFLETSHEPTSVVVNAAHNRERNNPVVRFFDGWSSSRGADIAARAEATVDNRIVGFRPLDGQPVPALPLAILRQSNDERTPTWQRDIEQRLGGDRFSIDPDTGAVIEQPDGIPEIVLRDTGAPPIGETSVAARSSTAGSIESDATPTVEANSEERASSDGDSSNQAAAAQRVRNAYAFVLNPRASTADIARQFRHGWLADDFPEGLDTLRTDRGPLTLTTLDSLGGAVADALLDVVGQQRIVFLFDSVTTGRGTDRVHCVATVAGRVMFCNPNSQAGCEIVFQPTVLTTRTAVLAHETVTQGPSDRFANRYTYKLQLTQ